MPTCGLRQHATYAEYHTSHTMWPPRGGALWRINWPTIDPVWRNCCFASEIAPVLDQFWMQLDTQVLQSARCLRRRRYRFCHDPGRDRGLVVVHVHRRTVQVPGNEGDRGSCTHLRVASVSASMSIRLFRQTSNSCAAVRPLNPDVNVCFPKARRPLRVESRRRA